MCRLTRENVKDPYGFDIRTLKENGRHIVNSVKPESKAAKAGIRSGDFILEVNGDSVETLPHNRIMEKLTAYPNLLDLLVVSDIEGYRGRNISVPSYESEKSLEPQTSQREDIENEKRVVELKKIVSKTPSSKTHKLILSNKINLHYIILY